MSSTAKKRLRIAAFAVIAALSAIATANAGGFAVVSNGNDSGAGSLRQPLEIQRANFVFVPGYVGDININATIEYSCKSPLTIFGSGQTVATLNNVTLLALTEAAASVS